MQKKTIIFLLALCLPVIGFLHTPEAQTMNSTLNARQQGIITISAYTANGDLEKLKAALNEGLEAGLSVNEIKEVLVQLYAYTGFPRSLNGIHTFMTVMDERQARGITDEVGRDASPLPADVNRDRSGAETRAKIAGQSTIPPASGYQLFAPAIDAFLKEHLFADIFSRDILDWQSRELATISALAAMTGTGGQLRFHMNGAMNMGLSEKQMKDFIAVLDARVGRDEAAGAESVLNAVLESRPE